MKLTRLKHTITFWNDTNSSTLSQFSLFIIFNKSDSSSFELLSTDLRGCQTLNTSKNCLDIQVSQKTPLQMGIILRYSYRIFSTCPLSMSKQSDRRSNQFWWTRVNVAPVTCLQDAAILLLKWFMFRIFFWYTIYFRWPQKQKSMGVKSGDLGATPLDHVDQSMS